MSKLTLGFIYSLRKLLLLLYYGIRRRYATIGVLWLLALAGWPWIHRLANDQTKMTTTEP